MARKKRFPEEETKPGVARPRPQEARRSSPAPKTKREASEAPTLPPPPIEEGIPPTRPSGRAGVRNSGMRSRKPAVSDHPSATVDEVTADLSKDPRREADDD